MFCYYYQKKFTGFIDAMREGRAKAGAFSAG
jgi:hypothetical protein